MQYEELLRHLGQKVIVTPRISAGMSRDSEPGMQPWESELVGRTRGMAIIDQGEEYGLRLVDPEALKPINH